MDEEKDSFTGMLTRPVLLTDSDRRGGFFASG
jgi:hypothetical protein